MRIYYDEIAGFITFKADLNRLKISVRRSIHNYISEGSGFSACENLTFDNLQDYFKTTLILVLHPSLNSTQLKLTQLNSNY